MKGNLLVFWLAIVALPMSGQIRLDNPSFEGVPHEGVVPAGWTTCKEGSTPDILPGPWGVFFPPYDGNTFLGLITRDDGTWESVGQRLSKPLKARECYSFSLHLAHDNYYSGYNLPVKLRIWGCNRSCEKLQLLAETSNVKEDAWQLYSFTFFPEREVTFLLFEAYYATGVTFRYKGNILLDGCSTIDNCIRAGLD